MCEIQIGEWKELASTYAAEMLRGEFPKCGIKYTGKYGAGLVLILAGGTNLDLVREKARAAAGDSGVSYVFTIPSVISAIYGHIPTLTEVA